MPSSAPAIKRRKASMLSTTSTGSAHPLRQTSFPPESASRTPAYSRSPSADTMVSGSVAGGGQTKKKRGRKLKGAGQDNASTADVRSAASDPAGKNGKRRASNASLEEEEDGGDETTAIQMTSETIEQKAREKEHQALLIRGFDVDQAERYAVYRSSRLSDAIVRRVSCI
jgi:transcription initiation factor TFIID subunit 11